MFEQTDAQLFFPFFADRNLIVQRHAGQISSDAGLLPIRQLDQRLHFTERLAAGLADDRHEPQHTQLEMLRQRLYGILADYEDCNDHDTLRDDPIFKLLADRLPEDDPLASQPTLSRFENAVTIDTLWRTLDFLTTTGIERLREKNAGQLPAALTLDLEHAGVTLTGITLSVLPVTGTDASLLVMEVDDDSFAAGLPTEEEGGDLTTALLASPQLEAASITELVTVYRSEDEEGPFTMTFAVTIDAMRQAAATGESLGDAVAVQVDRGSS